jgi:hypothetical protein
MLGPNLCALKFFAISNKKTAIVGRLLGME